MFFLGLAVGILGTLALVRYLGVRWSNRMVEVLAEEMKNPEPWTDPLITIRRGDGDLIAEMTLWEWVARAVVNHDLPPAELDYMTIHLDGIPVNR